MKVLIADDERSITATLGDDLEEAGHEVLPLGVAADGCWRDVTATRELLAGGAEQISSPGGAPLGF